MQEAAKNLLLVLVTLFPVDPLGGSPFFLVLTREYSPEARKALSWRIAVNSFFLLVATYFVGTYGLTCSPFWDFAASGAGRRRPDRWHSSSARSDPLLSQPQCGS
jgi:small neutral amino acid transporter SnatA (MarC family)